MLLIDQKDVTIRLPISLVNAIRAVCEREERSLAAQIRLTLIERYIDAPARKHKEKA